MSSEASYRKLLKSQVRDEYGKFVYTHTVHSKMEKLLAKGESRFKNAQIILSAVMTGGFFSNVFLDEPVVAVIGTAISTTLLVIDAYLKQMNFSKTEALRKCTFYFKKVVVTSLLLGGWRSVPALTPSYSTS